MPKKGRGGRRRSPARPRPLEVFVTNTKEIMTMTRRAKKSHLKCCWKVR